MLIALKDDNNAANSQYAAKQSTFIIKLLYTLLNIKYIIP